jgi:hypothetical protein
MFGAPVEAELFDADVYRILEQPYDRDIETWEYVPGDLVVAERVPAHGGTMLGATRRASA